MRQSLNLIALLVVIITLGSGLSVRAATLAGVPLLSYGGRISVERLAQPIPHQGALNTHLLRLDRDVYYINDADAYYLIKCLNAVRKDVEHEHLYRPPGYRETWDFEKK